jgi:hypothetical protein
MRRGEGCTATVQSQWSWCEMVMDTLILIGTGLGRLVELRLNARVDWDGAGLWLVLLSCSRGIYCLALLCDE